MPPTPGSRLLPLLLLGLVLCLACLLFGRQAATGYLKTKATPWFQDSSPDGRFNLVVYRYPELRHLPEIVGFGEGFVCLEESATGRVLGEKPAEELSSINRFLWESNRVTIFSGPGDQPGPWASWELSE